MITKRLSKYKHFLSDVNMVIVKMARMICTIELKSLYKTVVSTTLIYQQGLLCGTKFNE